MRCPACGRETPDALMVCRHCGASTRPSILQRLFGRLRRPHASVSIGMSPPAREVLTADEEPLGIEMPALGVKTMSVTVSQSSSTQGAVLSGAGLDADMLEKLRRVAAAGGAEVRYERVERDDGRGNVTVSESGTPLDPDVRAALEKLLNAKPGAGGVIREQQVIVETNGTRQVYGSVEDMPPEVRKLLGRFAESPISDDGSSR
jgi:hypothetical protein